MVGIVRALLALFAALLAMLLAAPILVLGLPFLVVAFVTRAVARLLEPKFLLWQQIIAFDPTLGWKPKPNLEGYGLADDLFHLTTDSAGWRGQTSLAESELVVFGDSFAFGYGVDDKALFSDLNPKLRIKAIGSPGYSMVQCFLLMRQLSSQLKDKLVVWFIYLGNDLYENIMPDMQTYRAPFVCRVNGRRDWEIVTRHVSSAKWPYTSKRRLYLDLLAKLCCPNYLSQRVYDACEFLIKEGNTVCNQAGAQLVVMTIPDSTQLSQLGLEFLSSRSGDPKHFNADFPDQRIAQACRNWGVPFVAGKQHLDVLDYKEGDVHWTEKGHRVVGKLLSRLYQDYPLSKMEKAQPGSHTTASHTLEGSGSQIGLAPISK